MPTDPFFLLLFAHLLGAAVWTGGHLVLALAILPRALRESDVAGIRAFEAAYERIGLPALVIQVATGVWLGWRLVPDLAGWTDMSDPLARALMLKLGCLAATAALGLHARLGLIPRLTPATLPVLAWHIRGVTLVALAFTFAGASIRLGGLFP